MDERKAKRLCRSFQKKFDGKSGRIKGGNGATVVLTVTRLSFNCAAFFLKEFGCGLKEAALLIDWVPLKEWPELVDDHKAALSSFPREYRGLKIYYRRGNVIVAQ